MHNTPHLRFPTNAVRREHAPPGAMERMLAGTGLHAIPDEISGAVAVRLLARGVPSDSNGYQSTNAVSATALNMPLADVPMNINVVLGFNAANLFDETYTFGDGIVGTPRRFSASVSVSC